MKFYLTSETYFRLQNNLSNINSFGIIDVDFIIKSLNLDMSKDYNKFLVNSEISKLILNYSKNRKNKGIIYIYSNLSENIVNNIKDVIKDINSISELVLLDDYNLPKLKFLYDKVDEIMYFSTFRRVRIIECKSIKELKK